MNTLSIQSITRHWLVLAQASEQDSSLLQPKARKDYRYEEGPTPLVFQLPPAVEVWVKLTSFPTSLGFRTRHHKDWFDGNAEDI